MKKILLLALCALCVVLIHAQNQGYFWYFNTAPFNSIPATSGSTGSYTLTTIGSGSITPGTNNNIVLGDCNGNFPVGNLIRPFGLQFSNSPFLAGGTYTISMAYQYSNLGSTFTRIINFENAVSGPDRGVYIGFTNMLNFYEGFNIGTHVTANLFPVNTWFQLDIVRNGATKLITCYKNGVQVGTYNDLANVFMPQASANFAITFFKDNPSGFEEADARVIKIGIFNFMLTPQQIQQNFANICDPAFVILPVSLKIFTAKKLQQQVELSWTTVEEHNNRGFEIQRSSDGDNFSRIGWMDGLGNSNTEHTYQFRDIIPVKGKNFYRLLQTDFDGHAKFSPVRKIDFETPVELSLFPNPVKEQLTILFTDQNEKEIMITDLQGKIIWTRKNVLSISITVPVQQLTKGIYLVKVLDPRGNQIVQKFIKE